MQRSQYDRAINGVMDLVHAIRPDLAQEFTVAIANIELSHGVTRFTTKGADDFTSQPDRRAMALKAIVRALVHPSVLNI